MNLIVKRYSILIALIILSLFAANGCSTNSNSTELSSLVLTVKYDSLMHSIVIPKFKDTDALMKDYSASEKLVLVDDTLANFNLIGSHYLETDSSKKLILNGLYDKDNIKIEKSVSLEILNYYPSFVIKNVTYKNLSQADIEVKGWINDQYQILPDKNNDPAYWSYQSGTYADRRDWVTQVNAGFEQENYLGMNASDYGGGTPLVDVWRSDVGLAVGHLETVPKLVSLPVNYGLNSDGVVVAVNYKYLEPVVLSSQNSINTFKTFINVHTGDYYSSLKQFSKIMADKGLAFHNYPETSYEPIWCAWGYERNFTVEEVLGTLPKVKEIGYEWAVLDDGWQTAEGDWFLDPKKFPNGDDDMKKFVDEIHKQGLKAKLWWSPLAVDPGTELIKNSKDYLLLNKDGSKQDITWWDSYYLCPAYEPVVDYYVEFVKKIIGEWGYDGLKIDGQHLNGVPPCYNPAHNHKRPEESVEALPAFFEKIYEAAISIKPDAVIEICPCGTAYSFYILHSLNQVVSSDPLSSWQIRLKGKTLKALMGDSSPYYGDHVEISDNGSDFASTVGIGGVIGTKFTYPTDRLDHKNYLLTDSKEKEWKKWLDIYNAAELSKGKYLGELYDIGYDKPETHVVEKNDTIYYAFYAEDWNGNVNFRGLERGKYIIYDYVNNKELGEVENSSYNLEVSFKKFLLVKAIKIK